MFGYRDAIWKIVEDHSFIARQFQSRRDDMIIAWNYANAHKNPERVAFLYYNRLCNMILNVSKI
jgi:hypothetical protein